MNWFKFYGGDYLNDPKMRALSVAERQCWLTLLCHASLNFNGKVKHLTEDFIMVQSGISPGDKMWKETLGFFKKFEKLEMVKLDVTGTVTVLNWEKRQSGQSESLNRVRRWRERNGYSNATETVRERDRKKERGETDQMLHIKNFRPKFNNDPKTKPKGL